MNAWKGDYWCKLCLAPIAAWERHVGSREHQCNRLFYGSITRSQRWAPINLLRSALFRFDFDQCHAVVDLEDKLRRERLLSCVQFLMRKGIVDADLHPHSEHCFHGGNIMKELAAPILLRLFPGASVQEYSAFMQMAICSYNMETLWDLAQFNRLMIPIKRKITFQEKGNRLQTLVGSISPHAMDALGSCPLLDECGATHTIASFVLRCVVSELLYIRSIEYVLKASAAWQREQVENDTVSEKKSVTLRNRFDSAVVANYLKKTVEAELWRNVPSMPNVFMGPM